jgi:hypothetical protein
MNFLVSIKGVLVEAARFSHRSATAPPPLTMKLGLGYKTRRDVWEQSFGHEPKG